MNRRAFLLAVPAVAVVAAALRPEETFSDGIFAYIDRQADKGAWREPVKPGCAGDHAAVERWMAEPSEDGFGWKSGRCSVCGCVFLPKPGIWVRWVRAPDGLTELLA